MSYIAFLEATFCIAVGHIFRRCVFLTWMSLASLPIFMFRTLNIWILKKDYLTTLKGKYVNEWKQYTKYTSLNKSASIHVKKSTSVRRYVLYMLRRYWKGLTADAADPGDEGNIVKIDQNYAEIH